MSGIEQSAAIAVPTESAERTMQQMSDFFLLIDDDPGELSHLAIGRLQRLFGEGNPVEQLSMVRDDFPAFSAKDQENLFLYFCGFPDDGDKLEAGDAVPLERSVARLVDFYKSKGKISVPLRLSRDQVDEAEDARRATWMKDAACLDVDPEIFYPERAHESTNKIAKAVCRGCIVWEKCLDEALSLPLDQDWGVWGGTSRRERIELRGQK